MTSPLRSPAATPATRTPARLRATLATVRDLFALTRGRFWMLPLVLALLVASVLFVVVGVVQYAAPFVYTVF